MPQELRDQLEKAAKRSGRSLTQELLNRLHTSFGKNKPADPAVKKAIQEAFEEFYQLKFNIDKGDRQ
jgi:hypothetical protein